MNENHRLEYKQQLTPELEKEVVAFLNSNHGGMIYLLKSLHMEACRKVLPRMSFSRVSRF